MTSEEFKAIVDQSESSLLDFKLQQYKVTGDGSDEGTSKFIKDVVCMCNTPRDKPGFIVIGIQCEDHEKKLIGLDVHVDEAVFQDKIKDKFSPKPTFSYYTFEYDSKTFGIFEIPVHKYLHPITPLKELKGLERDKVYFRRGSMNDVCSVGEIIQINDWLRGLKQGVDKEDINDKIKSIIVNLNSDTVPLSNLISEGLFLAIEIKNQDLIDFCKGELQGWKTANKFTKNRSILSFWTFDKIERIIGLSETQFRSRLKADTDKYFEAYTTVSDSILHIEDQIKNGNSTYNYVVEARKKAKELIDTKSDAEVYMYNIISDFKSIHGRIRHAYLVILTNLIAS